MILAISGKIGNGKDTIGQIIQYLTVSKFQPNTLINTEGKLITQLEHFNQVIKTWDRNVQGIKISNEYNKDKHIDIWEIHKFADTLKDIVCLLIGCTREQLEDHEFKNTELGEEWRVYYWSYYKFKSESNPLAITSQLFISKEEATEYKLKNSEFDWGIIKSSTLESYILTPRLLLQLLGTECGRNIIHPNIWINSLFSKYDSNERWIKQIGEQESKDKGLSSNNWIITDLRFPNELKAIKDRQGISIRVNRDPRYFICDNCMADNISINEINEVNEDICPRCKFNNESNLTMVISENNKHESETALDNIILDYTIDNSGTIEELIEKVKEILIKEKIL